MLIDYLVGGAIAISGMLALLIFGTDIIRMNTEAREYWQARSAMADFAGRRVLNSPTSLPSGELCRGEDPGWVADWCHSIQITSLPNVCAYVDNEATRLVLHWGPKHCKGEGALAASRKL